MSEQNFGSFISSAFLNKFKFDFYQNDENKFEERAEFYNDLMEEVVAPNKRENAFIAGGFFLKFKREKFKSHAKYMERCSRQDVNIYVYIGKNIFAPKLTELTNVIHENYQKKAEFQNKIFLKSVFATFKIESVKLNKETVRNVVIHVCSAPCIELLRKFTFNPCKIAYCYKANCLRAGYWFLKGGKLNNNDSSEKAGIIKRRFMLKNIDTEEITGTETKVEFVITKKAISKKL
jgi:hypothetical protein